MVFLTTQPLWLTTLLLIGVMTPLAMAAPAVVRRRVSLDKLSANNEVAGFKFAVVGVIYAVLLGFTIIVVWEKFSDAENDVALEASAAVTVFRLAAGVGGETEGELRARLTDYLEAAVTKDWPAMERGEESPATTEALNDVYAAALNFAPPDGRGVTVLTEILRQLDVMTQARRARLVLASGIVPTVVWMVLFAGAVLTVGFTFFFGAENLLAQTFMTGALALLIFSGLLVIVAIDHPFAGSVKVLPEALSKVLETFGKAAHS